MTLRAIPLAVATLLLPGAALGFTDKVHQDVAEQAARLMPASLRTIIGQHRAELREGAAKPLPVTEDGLFLYPDGTYGTLDQTVLRQTQRVLDLLSQRAPMGMVVQEMGVLSRAIALASDPTHVTPHDDRTGDWSPSFQRFVESRQPRFRVTFGGYAAEQLEKDDVSGFVQSCADRCRRTGPILGQMFLLPDGGVADTKGFDDRHPVFGVASIDYSNAVTNTARLWLYAWIRAGGDTTGLPFPQSLPAGAPGDAR